MHTTFIVPAPLAAISGGNGYDREVIAALRGAGHVVDVVELDGRFPVADAAAIAAVRAAWAGLSPDTVVIFDSLALPAFEGLADAIAGRHCVGLIHHPTSLETGFASEDVAVLDAAERRLFPLLARIVVTSPTIGTLLTESFGIDAARIHVVVPGTDPAKRSQGGGTTCEILSVGTLIPRKGHDILLRSLAKLFDLDWHLTIAGNATRDLAHAQQLAALADELDIARRVTFAGEVVGPALDRLWQQADLFALATYFEGYGMAVAEALRRGLPVAVCSGGAAGALVTPEAGAVCPPGDIPQLSKSLRRLIFDTGLRRNMADAAWTVGQALPDWPMQGIAFAKALA